MTRGVGEIELLHQYIPEWLAVVIALLTQLGDTWFLGLAFCVLYVVRAEDRDGIAAIAGLWLAGIGLYRGLKEVFALPRPNEPPVNPDVLPALVRPLYEATATASGYGFPSGHATTATIAYVGLAVVLTVGTRRTRFATAAAAVGIVAFSRLALGVHYLVDVLVGTGLGLLVVGAMWSLSRRRAVDFATGAFAFAIATSAFYVAVSGAVVGATALLGASIGAFGGWQLVVLGRQSSLGRQPGTVGAFSDRGFAVRSGLAVAAAALLVVSLPFAALAWTSASIGVVGFLVASGVVLPTAHRPQAVRGANAVRSWLG